MTGRDLIKIFTSFWVGFLLIAMVEPINGEWGASIDSYIPLIVGLLFFEFHVINVHAKVDASKTIHSHFSRFIIRGIIMALISLGLFQLDPNGTWLGAYALMIIQMMFFTTVFNIRYNHYRGNKWYYLGDTAFIDKTFHDNPGVYYILVSIFFSAGVYIYLLF